MGTEGFVSHGAVFLEQIYQFERKWAVSRVGLVLKVPLGKRVVVPPNSHASGIFPFKISGPALNGFFDVLGKLNLFVKLAYCPKSSNVKFSIFNSASTAVSLAAKTAVMGVMSQNGVFCISKLSGERVLVEDGQSFWFLESEIRINSVKGVNWAEKFPLIFAERVCAISPLMWNLRVQRTEFRLQGEVFGSTGLSYMIDKLITERSIVEAKLEEMRDCGYIEPVPINEVCHLHPLLFLPKGECDARLVCDLTEVNSYFVHVPGDLPGVDQLLRQIPSSWKVFAKLDIRNGFFRIPLDISVRNFFGFRYNNRRWRWKVMPQGWLLSAGIFHERITRILSDLSVISYVDDILIGAESLSVLCDKVCQVLQRLTDYGLQVQKKKFEFGLEHVRFLGFDIHPGGWVGAESYLKEKENLMSNRLRTKKDIQKILGVFNYIRSHVRMMGDTTARLQQILRGCSHVLTPEQSEEVTKIAREAWAVITES